MQPVDGWEALNSDQGPAEWASNEERLNVGAAFEGVVVESGNGEGAVECSDITAVGEWSAASGNRAWMTITDAEGLLWLVGVAMDGIRTDALPAPGETAFVRFGVVLEGDEMPRDSAHLSIVVDGKLVVWMAEGDLSPPEGIAVERGQEIFRMPVECGSVLHYEAMVTVGDKSVAVQPGGTADLGGLRIVNDAWSATAPGLGFCSDWGGGTRRVGVARI